MGISRVPTAPGINGIRAEIGNRVSRGSLALRFGTTRIVGSSSGVCFRRPESPPRARVSVCRVNQRKREERSNVQDDDHDAHEHPSCCDRLGQPSARRTCTDPRADAPRLTSNAKPRCLVPVETLPHVSHQSRYLIATIPASRTEGCIADERHAIPRRQLRIVAHIIISIALRRTSGETHPMTSVGGSVARSPAVRPPEEHRISAIHKQDNR